MATTTRVEKTGEQQISCKQLKTDHDLYPPSDDELDYDDPDVGYLRMETLAGDDRNKVKKYKNPVASTFKIGEEVYLWGVAQQAAGKPAGPFLVTEVIPGERYRVSCKLTGAVHASVVNGTEMIVMG